MRNRLLLFAVALVMAAVPALAQVDAGSIAGTVHDPSGAVVASATVTAKNLGTQVERTAQTNASGQYTIPGLNPGAYEVTATGQGFTTYKTRVDVTVGGRLTIDPTLKLGQSATTVEVVAESGAQVNTQSQEVSQVITPAQVQQLPSLTRNPYDFVATAGNISSGDRMGNANDQNTGSRGVGYVINGQRSAGTEILLDGAENTDLFTATVGQTVPQDSVQEYRIITNNFEAQYGRASGGVVNVTTKSGTNALHGSAWEFNRLSAYTANTYDNDANGLPKGKYTRNQFGYSIGGPIVKNRLFFFQSTEWLKVRSNASTASLVPTPELLALTPPNVQQYFSTYGGTTAPFSRTLTKADFAGDFNPGGVFDATVPAGVPAFGLVNFTAPQDAGGGSPQNTHNIVGRLDYTLSSNTQMFFRYGLQDETDFSGSAFASPYAQYNVGYSAYNNAALFNLTHTFSPSVLSNTKLSFNRLNQGNSYNTALQNTPTLFLYSSANLANFAVQLPGFYDNQTGTGGLPYGGPQNVLQGNEDLSWTRGSHNMRFGGQFNYQQINRGYGAFAQAIEAMGKSSQQGLDNLMLGKLVLFQVAADPQGKFPCVRDNFAALVATPECSLTPPVGAPVFSRSYRYRDFAFYAQDSWKATHKLTFNYGVRYEYYGVQHNSRPELDSNFYYGQGSNQFERVRNGSVQLAEKSPVGGLWNPNYGTIAPRIGFAYDLFGDGSTSLRGGFGISYERNFGNVTFNVIQNPPNYAGIQLQNALAGNVTVDNLGPLAGSGLTIPLPLSSPRHVDQNIDTAQTQMWSLSMERQLARNTVLALDYNGAHGVHLYDIKNINEIGGAQVYLGDPLVVDPACGGPCYTRPNQQYTSINNRGSSGYSHYNSLNVRFQTQNLFNTGVMLVTNYTWAHSLDNISSTFSEAASASNGVGNLGYLDPRNPSLDYGNSDFDVRHRFVLSAIWDVPAFKGRKGFLGQALGGFTLVPVFTARTGAPFSIMDSTNSLNGSGGYGIPRYTPDGSIPSFQTGSGTSVGPNDFALLTLPGTLNWSNAALGGISDFGPYPAGMTRRNAFRGPGAWNFDFAVSKNFSLTERVKLQFRAEAFNIFNHHNMYVNGYNNDAVGSTGDVFVVSGKKGGLGSLAGSSVVTGNPADERRFGQFALRVTF